VGVQDTEQRDVHEEALGGQLVNGQLAIGKVAGDDAGIVGSIPPARRGAVEEVQPFLDART